MSSSTDELLRAIQLHIDETDTSKLAHLFKYKRKKQLLLQRDFLLSTVEGLRNTLAETKDIIEKQARLLDDSLSRR